MPTTASGIYYPDSSTAFNPLETVFSTMASSIENILAADVQVHRVANTTARNALVSQFPPTAANPLFVWRTDAPNGRELEYTKNGTTWHYYSSSEDGGLAGVPLSGGTSGNLGITRQGNLVNFLGNVTRTWVANTTTVVGTVPAGSRPSVGVAISVSFNSGETGWGLVASDGTVSVRRPSAGANGANLGGAWYI